MKEGYPNHQNSKSGSGSKLGRAKIYLSENLINRNSWSRALCYILFDFCLILGLAWHLNLTVKDWAYW